MTTPRSSFMNGNKRDTAVSGSSYSTQALSRLSYIAGHETDEEERQSHTEDEVMAWGPERVAEYLEDHSVEKLHCDVFKEQEISGEVLLAMDQSSLFIKEFELGPVGRRLKTWHKIKALQEEVRQSTIPEVATNMSEYAGAGDEGASDGGSRNRASTVGTALPRALETSRSSSGLPGRSNTLQSLPTAAATSSSAQSSAVSPLQSMTSMSRPENTYRPSAQSIRQMQQSRRHSSIDSTSNSVASGRTGHRKQPSFDQKWQPGQAQTNGKVTGHLHALSSDSTIPNRDSGLITPSSPGELDRGYFSSNELDNRSRLNKNVLTKKGASATASLAHSRTNSFANQVERRSTQSGRIASADSLRDPPFNTGSAFAATSGMFGPVTNKFGNSRSATSPQPTSKPMVSTHDAVSPIVTKLDHSGNQSLNALTASPNPVSANDTSQGNTSLSPSSNLAPFFARQKAKVTGLRTISDAIIRTEKTMTSPVREKEVVSPARTGSTTPSTDTRSIDLQKSEAQSRTSQGSGANLVPPLPAAQRRTRPKTKKATSAYTRGLEKKTPAESMAGCDYSGWMKKKSGSLMTTWRSRLFVLKGRRLSYYYADSDTEEKGLIDISFHRVLPAHNETLTGLHAQLTGAAGTPTSPREASTPTAAQQDLKENPPKAGETDDGLFIFKLVPPKSGLSKGVNFTKPTVHYFAVNSRQEGRLWMAALMKATIDRDEEGMVTTTYNQKTISLAKARARRERPPALREDDDTGERAELDGDDSSSKGLGIGGVHEKHGAAVAGAQKEEDIDASSVAPSTIATGAESEVLNEKERETIALSAPS